MSRPAVLERSASAAPTVGELLVAAAAACAAATATIHLAAARGHWDHAQTMGMAFLASMGVQILWTLEVAARPTRTTLRLGAAMSVAFIGVWATSRTVGLPVAPDAWTREAVGFPDAFTVGLEAITAGACLAALSGGDTSRRVVGGNGLKAVAALALVLATVVAVRGASVHAEPVSHGSAGSAHCEGCETTDTYGSPIPLARSAAVTGLEPMRVSVATGGGMIDVRYEVVDAPKARELLGDHGVAVYHRASGTTLSTPWMGHTHADMDDGDAEFLLLLNLGGRIRRGDVVDVAFGDVLVGPIEVG